MANDVISYFGRNPNDMALYFSMTAASLQGKAANVVTKTVEVAQDRMLAIIDSGGINPSAKGGPRVLSGDMRSAVIGAEDVASSRGRVTGNFGFADDAPDYTKFQEKGTNGRTSIKGGTNDNGSGIPAMLAYETARFAVIDTFDNLMNSTHWTAPGLDYGR